MPTRFFLCDSKHVVTEIYTTYMSLINMWILTEQEEIVSAIPILLCFKKKNIK